MSNLAFSLSAQHLEWPLYKQTMSLHDSNSSVYSIALGIKFSLLNWKTRSFWQWLLWPFQCALHLLLGSSCLWPLNSSWKLSENFAHGSLKAHQYSASFYFLLLDFKLLWVSSDIHFTHIFWVPLCSRHWVGQWEAVVTKTVMAPTLQSALSSWRNPQKIYKQTHLQNKYKLYGVQRGMANRRFTREQGGSYYSEWHEQVAF